MFSFRSQPRRKDGDQAQVLGGGHHEPGHQQPCNPHAPGQHHYQVAEAAEQLHQDEPGQKDHPLDEGASHGHSFARGGGKIIKTNIFLK